MLAISEGAVKVRQGKNVGLLTRRKPGFWGQKPDFIGNTRINGENGFTGKNRENMEKKGFTVKKLPLRKTWEIGYINCTKRLILRDTISNLLSP